MKKIVNRVVTVQYQGETNDALFWLEEPYL